MSHTVSSGEDDFSGSFSSTVSRGCSKARLTSLHVCTAYTKVYSIQGALQRNVQAQGQAFNLNFIII